MSNSSMLGKAAIVGIGESRYHDLYRSGTDHNAEDLALDLTERALDDAGLSKDDIDGLIVGGMPRYEQFMFRSGLRDVRFLAHYPSAARLCPEALGHAAMAVHHGLANYVLLFNSVAFRTSGTRFGGDRPPGAPTPVGTPPLGDLYDSAYGMASPGASYSLAFSRYQNQYGATEEELGRIAVSIRAWATRNPNAIFSEPITLRDYLASRYIARPLHLYDYCLVNDGAAGYIVTTPERARDLRHPPVLIGSFATRASVREQYVSEDLWASACVSLKANLLDTIGLTLEDVSSLQVYDNFSCSVLWVLEGFGFAPRGEGLRWLADGRIGPGGSLPVNTSGGMLSEAYIQGWNHHVEAVRQLRGEAGDRQVPDCRVVLYAALSAVPAGDVLMRAE